MTGRQDSSDETAKVVLIVRDALARHGIRPLSGFGMPENLALGPDQLDGSKNPLGLSNSPA